MSRRRSRSRQRRRSRHSKAGTLFGDLRVLFEKAEPGSGRRRRRSGRRQRRRIAYTALAGVGVIAVVAVIVAVRALIPNYDAREYEVALSRLEAGDVRAALDSSLEILDRSPDHLPSRILAGRAYLELGRAYEAESELRNALYAGADRALTLVPLARAMLLQGKYEELFEDRFTETRDRTLQVELLTIRGDAHLHLRQLDEAAQAYDEAASIRPENVGSILGRARVSLSRGRYENATKLVESAKELAPGRAQTWFVAGEINRRQLHREGALAGYDEALRLDPNYLEARLARAAILIESNEDSPALDDLRSVWDVRPDHPEANYLYALVLSKVGELDKAREVLERASSRLMGFRTEYVMRHPPSLLLLGLVYYRNENYDRAFPLLDRYVQFEPNHTGVRKLLATILLIRELPTAAIAMLEPALETAPNDPELLALLGQAYTRNRRPERATKLLERAVALTPRGSDVRTQLALSRLALKQSSTLDGDEDTTMDLGAAEDGAGTLVELLRRRDGTADVALVTARALVHREPDNAAVRNLLGATQFSVGRPTEARSSFERALELDPTYSPAHRNLAKLEVTEGNLEGASRRLRELLGRDPDDVRTLIELAAVDRKRERIDEAIKWLERARGLAPELLAPQLDLVELYLRSGNPGAAAELVHGLEQAFPRSMLVRIAKGQVLFAAGDREVATKTFRALSDERTMSPARRIRIAEFQLAGNDVEGSRHTLQQILESDPRNLRAQAMQVEIEVREGRYDSALSLAEELREAHPGSALGDRVHGDVLMRMSRYRDAAAAFEAGLRKSDTPMLALRLAEALRQSGDLAAAAAAIERRLAAHPEALDLRQELVRAYLALGRYQDARHNLEQILASRPDDPYVLASLAGIYLKAGDPRARDFAERAHRLDQENALALDMLGWVLIHDGQPREALRYLREAHSRSSKDLRIRYHIAVALKQLGREREARRELTRTLAGGEPFDGVLGARALLRELGGS